MPPLARCALLLEPRARRRYRLAAQENRPSRPPENVKVLTDLEGQPLRAEMQRISAALGVKCDHCHVQGNFASDEKSAQARRPPHDRDDPGAQHPALREVPGEGGRIGARPGDVLHLPPGRGRAEDQPATTVGRPQGARPSPPWTRLPYSESVTPTADQPRLFLVIGDDDHRLGQRGRALLHRLRQERPGARAIPAPPPEHWPFVYPLCPALPAGPVIVWADRRPSRVRDPPAAAHTPRDDAGQRTSSPSGLRRSPRTATPAWSPPSTTTSVRAPRPRRSCGAAASSAASVIEEADGRPDPAMDRELRRHGSPGRRRHAARSPGGGLPRDRRGGSAASRAWRRSRTGARRPPWWRRPASARRSTTSRAPRATWTRPLPWPRPGPRRSSNAARCGCGSTTWTRRRRLSGRGRAAPGLRRRLGQPRRHAGRARSAGRGARRLRAAARPRSDQSPGATTTSAWSRRELGRLAESEAAFRRVIDLEPNLAFGYYNLGHTLFLQGRYHAAASAYGQGQARDPERNPVQGHALALCRLATGDAPGR